MEAPRFTIAIDGPAASGKGTIARQLAARYGFGHLDTGLLYRAVGRRLMQGVDAVEAARTLDVSALDPVDLRRPEVAQAASKVAALPEVRGALVDLQRAFAQRSGGAVLDGRDIGTVICPQAEVKLFVTASAETRALRRFREQVAAGHDVPYEAVLADVRERDERDMGRKDAPLKPAADAVMIDTSDLDIEAAVAHAVQVVEAARAALSET